jgi:hypothetical protein
MEYGMPKNKTKIRKYKIMTIIIIVRRLAKPTQATALSTPQTTSFDDVFSGRDDPGAGK